MQKRKPDATNTNKGDDHVETRDQANETADPAMGTGACRKAEAVTASKGRP